MVTDGTVWSTRVGDGLLALLRLTRFTEVEEKGEINKCKLTGFDIFRVGRMTRISRFDTLFRMEQFPQEFRFHFSQF